MGHPPNPINLMLLIWVIFTLHCQKKKKKNSTTQTIFNNSKLKNRITAPEDVVSVEDFVLDEPAAMDESGRDVDDFGDRLRRRRRSRNARGDVCFRSNQLRRC
ncbi:hypothetical protein HanRHA438_Chr11g0494221 [Helianthus annuus]|nr:hypothetical protein HanRHA438_Chr11g0494221 [Helianthus annuus]